jgi:hypothetical protein
MNFSYNKVDWIAFSVKFINLRVFKVFFLQNFKILRSSTCQSAVKIKNFEKKFMVKSKLHFQIWINNLSEQELWKYQFFFWNKISQAFQNGKTIRNRLKNKDFRAIKKGGGENFKNWVCSYCTISSRSNIWKNKDDWPTYVMSHLDWV